MGKILRAAKDLGVEILYAGHENFEDLQDCPFEPSLGILFPNTIVIDTSFGEASPGNIIHEMGHLLVTKNTTSDEYSFLGWEFAVACYYGLVDEWLESMENYTIEGDGGIEFCSLSPEMQSDILEERLAYAKANGMVRGDDPRNPVIKMVYEAWSKALEKTHSPEEAAFIACKLCENHGFFYRKGFDNIDYLHHINLWGAQGSDQAQEALKKLLPLSLPRLEKALREAKVPS